MAELRKRVLIADDAGIQRRYYRQILEAANFDVTEALNGLEALEKLLLDAVDLVIADINMPLMDGLTFLDTLRRQSLPLGSIPAIVISTEAAASDDEAARRAGANVYLIKPVTADVLVKYAAMFCGIPDE